MIFTTRIDYDFWATLLKLFSSVKRVSVPSFILLSSRSRFRLFWAIIRPTIGTFAAGGLTIDSDIFLLNYVCVITLGYFRSTVTSSKQ